MRKVIYLFLLFTISSCAHTFMRGSVAKKLSSKKAIICLGKNEVKIGDLIKFEKSECNYSGSTSGITIHEITEASGIGGNLNHTGYGQSQCELIYLGRGKVTKLINDHFSIVEAERNFEFNESTQVEIIRE